MRIRRWSKSREDRYTALTLIETIVYLALFAVIFFSIMEFFFITSRSNQAAAEQIELQKASLFLMQHLDDTFENADDLDVASSIFDNDDGRLSFDIAAGYQEYALVGGRVQFDDNGTENYLTVPDFNVTKFRISTSPSTSGNLTLVTLEVRLESKKISTLERNIDTVYVLTQ